MAEHAGSSVCPKCCELERRIAVLEAQLAAAGKNSANSSKPPSSDIVKAALAGRKKKRKKRKRGGQPGHPKHERPAFQPHQIDKTQDDALDACPECGGKLEVLDQPASVVQQIEVVAQPTKVTEHRSRTCFCGQCNKQFVTPIPREVRQAGLVGPRMTALVGYLKGACHNTVRPRVCLGVARRGIRWCTDRAASDGRVGMAGGRGLPRDIDRPCGTRGGRCWLGFEQRAA